MPFWRAIARGRSSVFFGRGGGERVSTLCACV